MMPGFPLTAILAATSVVAVAGTIQWGAASQGRRLGIGVAGSPGAPALEVILQNRGPDTRDFEVPEPADHNLTFYATRDGRTVEVFDTAVLKQPTPGLPKFEHIVLAPGEQRVFLIPLERLIYV